MVTTITEERWVSLRRGEVDQFFWREADQLKEKWLNWRRDGSVMKRDGSIEESGSVRRKALRREVTQLKIRWLNWRRSCLIGGKVAQLEEMWPNWIKGGSIGEVALFE
jgi:hypothetical protein